MADIEQPPTLISQQLEQLSRTGKPADAIRLERELRRLQSEPSQTGV